MWVRRATANRSARSDGISASPGSDLVSGAGESGVGEKWVTANRSALGDGSLSHRFSKYSKEK